MTDRRALVVAVVALLLAWGATLLIIVDGAQALQSL
jgi:hypothetical protein